ncbi:hypothetical protein JW898_05745 [Candidatus Woesearchaeota archaeon]|nr:hypothetical protein [Candidatus Woesearchaeota archaeon]
MKKLAIASIIILLSLIIGCAARVHVKEVNEDPEKYMGKKVVVSGKVVAPMQMGTLSGFTLSDDKSTIIVSSDLVPQAGDTVTVEGIVVKGVFSGHYLFAEEVR